MARVWTPQKTFYEHPSLINLSKEDAVAACEIFAKEPISAERIVNEWVLIGN